MTPAQAKTVACPKAKAASVPTLVGTPQTKYFWVGTTDGCDSAIAGINRDSSGPISNTLCIADACMAWAWLDAPTKSQGFCMMFDKNAQKL